MRDATSWHFVIEICFGVDCVQVKHCYQMLLELVSLYHSWSQTSFLKVLSASSDLYRWMTIMPIISKLFERILLNILQPYLVTCNSRFGFLKGYSCSHAIYSVKKTIDNFCKLNANVNLCTLDISKAFDKVNHTNLFNK